MPDYRWSPISEYSNTFWEWETRARASCHDFQVCTINGERAWTDGRILCLGTPPGPVRDTPIEVKHMDRLLKEAEREMYELKPIAVVEMGSERPVILFESRHVIQAIFFNVVREKWPAVRFFASDDHTKPIVARVRIPVFGHETLVALIMGMRTDDWKERINEVLELMKGREANAT